MDVRQRVNEQACRAVLYAVAAYSKHRREDVLPLHRDLARRPRPWLAGGRVRPGPWAANKPPHETPETIGVECGG